MHSAGIPINQIKDLVIELLDPYVFDKTFLREYAMTALAAEAVNVGRIVARPDWASMLANLVVFRADVWRANQGGSIDTIVANYDKIEECYERVSSYALMEIPKADLEMREFAFECFRNIGTIAESCIFPHLRELLGLCNRQFSTLAAVHAKDFGEIVRDLGDFYIDKRLIMPAPWGISLSQWRNMAQHHDYKVTDDKISLTYGRGKNSRNISITRDELWAVTNEIFARLRILKSARILFIFDKRDVLGPYFKQCSNSDLRTEFLHLAASISTQGFKLRNAHVKEEIAEFDVADLSRSEERDQRAIHCSQFLAMFAEWFKGRSISILFSSTESGSPSFRFSITKEQAKLINEGADPLETLAPIFSIEHLKQ